MKPTGENTLCVHAIASRQAATRPMLRPWDQEPVRGTTAPPAEHAHSIAGRGRDWTHPSPQRNRPICRRTDSGPEPRASSAQDLTAKRTNGSQGFSRTRRRDTYWPPRSRQFLPGLWRGQLRSSLPHEEHEPGPRWRAAPPSARPSSRTCDRGSPPRDARSAQRGRAGPRGGPRGPGRSPEMRPPWARPGRSDGRRAPSAPATAGPTSSL